MGGGIYLIQDDDQLVEMMEQAYDSEDQLQELLETYPNLLAGDEIDRATPRRWLLISREVTIPAEEEASGRWSLDHLFLDQDATPTLVEIKRSHNAETRQKMLGQMLDYAANVGVYWPLESTITQFEANCRDQGRDPEQVFEEFLGSEADEEQFWQKVKTNIQARKIRLIFVADEIPSALRRVVEFLNEQTDPIEVWALEIKQYVSQDGLKTLVPRIIGQTAEAQQKKSSATGERRRWDEKSFFSEFQTRRGTDEAEMARKIHAWIHQQSETDIEWGTGDIYGGFAAILSSKGRKPLQLFSVDISGRLEISSLNYSTQPPFDREEQWLELRSQFSSVGLSLPFNKTEFRSPAIRLSTVQDEVAFKNILETFEWVIQEINNS